MTEGAGAAYPRTYEPTEAFARAADSADPLASFRERFHLPADDKGRPVVYFAGNSLGLQPRETQALVAQELEDWARLGVDGHFDGRTPWYSYHEAFRDCGARLVGGRPGEVVMMNSLTVNLHLMMISFYRPSAGRSRIVMESTAFPSDTYAIRSQLRLHGIGPDEGLVVLSPRDGEDLLRTEDVLAFIDREGDSVAMFLMSGVNYYTGQWFDMEAITAAARGRGCVVGWDLAHAAGNVPMQLHDWNVDFAAWCNYKYLNSGPGAVAACFVHERHARDAARPRLAGWWGNDPATRFRMHLEPEFIPREGADGWQISNPPILAMAPIRASYALFDEATMPRLRAKSLALTGYLEFLVDRLGKQCIEIITPRRESERGCQLSLRVKGDVAETFRAVQQSGVVCDVRKPDVLRVAPVPLYNSFHDVWRFAAVLADVHGKQGQGT